MQMTEIPRGPSSEKAVQLGPAEPAEEIGTPALGKVLFVSLDVDSVRIPIQQLRWHGLEVRITSSTLNALGLIADYDPEVLWLHELDSELSLEEILDALKIPRQINPIAVVISPGLNARTRGIEFGPGDEVLDLQNCADAPTPLLQFVKLAKLERQVIRREREIFDSLPNALLVVDRKLTLWKVNRRVSQLLEIADPDFRRKALGRPLGSAFAAAGLAKDERSAFPQLVGSIKECMRSGRERFRAKETIGGTERLLSGEITPLVHSPEHVLIDLRDITADEQAVLAGARRERLATIGNLAVGVAHEIQNPNTFSRVNAANLKMMFDALRPRLAQAANETGSKIGNLPVDMFLSKMSEAISAVDMASRRIESVLGTLKSFGREDDGQPDSVDLKSVVGEAVMLVGHEARGKAEILITLPDTLPPVTAHATGLSQVLVNLLQNALHALDAPGPQARRNGPAWIRITCEAINEDEVILAVADNGPGISESLQQKIFRPYFTTKPQGQGTGLGLSISTDMLHRFGGDMTLRSREGEGATFYIKLRRFEASPANS